jgi:hypothetical protein
MEVPKIRCWLGSRGQRPTSIEVLFDSKGRSTEIRYYGPEPRYPYPLRKR